MGDPLGTYNKAPVRSPEYQAKMMIYESLGNMYQKLSKNFGADGAREILIRELKKFINKVEGE